MYRSPPVDLRLLSLLDAYYRTETFSLNVGKTVGSSFKGLSVWELHGIRDVLCVVGAPQCS